MTTEYDYKAANPNGGPCVFCGRPWGGNIDACPGGERAVAYALGIDRGPAIDPDGETDLTSLYAFHDGCNEKGVTLEGRAFILQRWQYDWCLELEQALTDYLRHIACGEARGIPEGLARPCEVCGRDLCPCDWGM